MNLNKLSRNFIGALRKTTTNCRVSFIDLYLVFPTNFRIEFLPHTNTVILLEPYCGTITEPGLTMLKLEISRSLSIVDCTCFHPSRSAKSSLNSQWTLTWRREKWAKWRLKVFTCLRSLSVSSKLSKKKKARYPFQFKFIVKYDFTECEVWVVAAK